MFKRRPVVFDCNVCFQGLVSPGGPSAACLAAAGVRRVQLYSSVYCVEELLDVASRADLRQKFRITDDRVDRFVQKLNEIATFVEDVPERFVHPTDPDDSHYVNLALAANAELIVSRDRDLLRFMRPGDKEGEKFRHAFPGLVVTNPEGLLRELEENL